MRYGCRLMILVLAAMVALSAGCRRGGKDKADTEPATSATKPPPGGGAPTTPPPPPEVKPGDIAGKARVVFGFYLEKGPLTPSVKWDKSEGRLTISHVHSSVNIGPGFNTRIASEEVSEPSLRNLIVDYVTTTVGKLPEVKVLELHVLFEGKDVARVTATQKEMKDAIAAASEGGKNAPRGQRWRDVLLKKLPGVWIAPKLGE